ncbi:MAG: hypothetical protein CL868_12190 [Cytophagaceae bacterium]|nr:hypothetical protein [Cytophagaceae bacterium]|tara:strand:+ start:6094 stop:6450 length:357 start_codon:yes stop_codon:yes gene_type:complete
MTAQLKLEGAGLLVLFAGAYFYLDYGWGFFALLFFAPDLSFFCYLLNTRVGAVAYNIMHHQGIFAVLLVVGFYFSIDWLIQLSLVFLAHSAFDRMLGYGLKYPDDFKHTHLGWMGKKK